MGLAPKPKSLPLLPRLSQGRNSGEGTPSSSPVSVFGEEPCDRGSRRQADEERRLLPQRRHGGGASWVPPHPRGAPPLSRLLLAGSGEEAARFPAAAGRRIQKSRTLLSPHLRKELAGRSEARGAREGRGGESGAGMPRGQDRDSRLGRKHFCSQTRGRPGKPSLPRPPPPPGAPSGRARQRRAEKSVALLVTEIWGR